MEATTQKKTLAIVLSLGAAVIAMDRFFLSAPESASAAAETAVDGPVGVTTVSFRSPLLVLDQRLATRQASGETADTLQADPFSAPDSWVGPIITQDVSTVPRGPDQQAFLARNRLVAVISRGTQPGASFNGRFYRIGEQIDGFTIAEVREHSVILAAEHQTFELFIMSPDGDFTQ